MSIDVAVRPALPSDVDSIARIYSSAFSDTLLTQLGPRGAELCVRWWGRQLECRDSLCLVAVVDGGIGGMVYIHWCKRAHHRITDTWKASFTKFALAILLTPRVHVRVLAAAWRHLRMRVAGLIRAEPKRDSTHNSVDRVGWIQPYATDSLARGRGVAKRLLAEGLAAAWSRSCQVVKAQVEEGNYSSIRCCERSGGTICGRSSGSVYFAFTPADP
jgi:RimJ/RimL family protein N-acetyltransferase